MRDIQSNILLPLAMVIGIMIGMTNSGFARETIIFSIASDLNSDSTTTPIVKEPTSTAKSATTSDGPIRDWSNPPGFKGYSSQSGVKMKKHKGLTPNKKRQKYHPKKKGRCYSF